MKKIFKAIAVLSATALVAVSCNVEAVSTIFDPSTVEAENSVSFVQSVVVDQEIPAATATYSIPMARSIATEALTVKLTSTLPAAIECPASITFAAGESDATLVLNISNMSVGETFKGKISVNLDDAAKKVAFSNYEVSCTFAKAYTWEDIGEGEFYDGLALQPNDTDLGIIKVKVEKAVGFDRWRVYNLFPKDNVIAAWDETYYSGGATEMIEVWANGDEDDTVSYSPVVWATGLFYKALGTNTYIYYYLPSAYSTQIADEDAYNCFVDDAGKVIQFYVAQAIENTNSWFGRGAKYLSLPGGPDLESFLSE